MGSLPAPPTLTARSRTTNMAMEEASLTTSDGGGRRLLRLLPMLRELIPSTGSARGRGRRSERDVVVDRPGPGAATAGERRTALARRRAVGA